MCINGVHAIANQPFQTEININVPVTLSITIQTKLKTTLPQRYKSNR